MATTTRESDPAQRTATRWEVVLYRDGEQTTDRVRVSDWEAATIAAPLVAELTGGTISVASAVVDERVRHALVTAE